MLQKRIAWNNYFKDLVFNEALHKYSKENSDIKFTSVTQYISSLKPDTFTDEFIRNYAEKNNKPFDYIKALWDVKKVVGATKGTELHYYIESWYKWGIEHDVSPLNIKEVQYFKNFLNDNKTLSCIQSEYRVYDEDLKFAGTIDAIMYDFKTKEYMIYDWKTNKTLASFNKELLAYPFNNLRENPINDYTIQLCIYKYILEKHIPNIVISKLRLVHLNSGCNDNYKVVDLKTDVFEKVKEKVLELRK